MAKKRKLSQTPAAKRARKVRREKKVAREKASKKAQRTKRQNAARRAELESLRESEKEAKRAQRAKRERYRAGNVDEREVLSDVLGDMRDSSPIELDLFITESEIGARIPWAVVGRFALRRSDLGYQALHAVFSAWRDDLLLEARIHPQRLSQIRIVYSDPSSKRGDGDSIVSTTGPWEAVVSEQAHEVDPSDEDSLATRYKDTVVPHFYVYLSSQLATEIKIRL